MAPLTLVYRTRRRAITYTWVTSGWDSTDTDSPTAYDSSCNGWTVTNITPVDDELTKLLAEVTEHRRLVAWLDTMRLPSPIAVLRSRLKARQSQSLFCRWDK